MISLIRSIRLTSPKRIDPVGAIEDSRSGLLAMPNTQPEVTRLASPKGYLSGVMAAVRVVLPWST